MPSLVNLLKDVDVEAISLVPSGANGQRIFLFKCDGFECSTTTDLGSGRIVKGDAEDWSAFYIVVAEPGAEEKPGLHGDQTTTDVWADEDEIRKAAHRFMRNGGLINKLHQDLDPYGQLVENAIAHSDFQVGTDTIRKGSWYIAVEPTEEGRRLVNAGELGGVSIQGSGHRVAKDGALAADSGKIGPMELSLLERIGKAIGIEPVEKCDLVDGCECLSFEVDSGAAEDAPVDLAKAKLNAAGRKALPKTAFALPSKAPGSGSFPVHDRAHAIAALARSKGKPEEKTVHAAVCKRFPDLPACQSSSPVAKDESLREDGGSLASMELGERVEQLEKGQKDLTDKVDGLTAEDSPLMKGIQSLNVKFEELSSDEKKKKEDADAKRKAEEESTETPETVAKKLDEVAEGQELLAKSLLGISELVENMAEKADGSRQVDEKEPVKKADAHPLAGLLS